jgi:DNA-binding response OmpR family regulator
MISVLVVEDDVQFNKIMCSHLSNYGYDVVGCSSGANALAQMEKLSFDVIVSDVMMKEMNGFEFVKQARLIDDSIPVLLLTARDDMTSKEQGYKIGIDDYIVKPVEIKELIFRIEAVLRRANISSKSRIVVGGLVLDTTETCAYLDGVDLGLSVKEFNILFKLLSYPKRTFTRVQLMNDFWGYESESAPRTVDVCITKLRGKLKACTDIEIVTVHGLGYKAVILI